MADLSFVFDPSDMGSKIAANDTKADAASSRIAESSGTWETVAGSSDAASKVSIAKLSLTSAISALSVTAASAASDLNSALLASVTSAISALSVTAASAASELDSAVRLSLASAVSALSVTAASAASDAASAMVAALSAKVIHSEPGSNSRAVHEIMMTSKGSVKYVYSSNAAA